ncbi:hypothetical protein D3C78_1670260 [compost metagenome]
MPTLEKVASSALWKYCSASIQPLKGRSTPRHIRARIGRVTTKCTQTGGWTLNSKIMKPIMPTMPTADMTKKAGPSAGSAKP